VEGRTGSREDRHLNCKLGGSQHVWQFAAETGDWKHRCVTMILNWVKRVCCGELLDDKCPWCTEVGTAVMLFVSMFAVNCDILKHYLLHYHFHSVSG
jgi:hypothetical protein